MEISGIVVKRMQKLKTCHIVWALGTIDLGRRV